MTPVPSTTAAPRRKSGLAKVPASVKVNATGSYLSEIIDQTISQTKIEMTSHHDLIADLPLLVPPASHGQEGVSVGDVGAVVDLVVREVEGGGVGEVEAVDGPALGHGVERDHLAEAVGQDEVKAAVWEKENEGYEQRKKI